MSQQWLPLPLFLVYRLIAAFYFLSWLIYSGFSDGNYWFIFLSNWVLTFVTAYFLLAMFITTHYCCGSGVEDDPAGYGPRRFKSETYIVGLSSEDENETEDEGTSYATKEDDEDGLSWPQKVLWVLFDIGSVTSLVITIFYWSTLYPVKGGAIDGLNINEHILAAVFMLIEVVFSNIPIRLLHFFYPHAFSSIYVLFSVIYWGAGGKNKEGLNYIYQIIDYEKEPGRAIFMVFFLLIVTQTMVHLFLFILFRFRAWLISKLQ